MDPQPIPRVDALIEDLRQAQKALDQLVIDHVPIDSPSKESVLRQLARDVSAADRRLRESLRRKRGGNDDPSL